MIPKSHNSPTCAKWITVGKILQWISLLSETWGL